MKNKWIQRIPSFLGILYGIFYSFSIYRYTVFFKLDKLISSIALLISIPIHFMLSRFIRKKGIEFSPLFHIGFLSFIFISLYIGTVCDYYIVYYWWDIMLHTLAGVLCVPLGIHLINIFIDKEVIGYIKSPLLISIIVFCFSITASALWEVFEYLCDVLLKTNMTSLSLDDTMGDLVVGTLGALGASIVYCFISKKRNSRKS